MKISNTNSLKQILLAIAIAVPQALSADNRGFGAWLSIGPEAGGRINSIAVTPADANMVYVGTNDGIFRSFDRGETFEAASGAPVASLPSNVINSIRVDPNNPFILYAASFFGIDKSVDGGST